MNNITGLKFLGAAAALSLAGCMSTSHEEPTPQALTKASSTGFCPKLEKFYGEFASRTCNSAGSCVDLILDAWEPMLECLDIERPAGNTLQEFEDVVDELIENVPSSSEAAEFSECVCGGSPGGGTGSIGASLDVSRSSAAGSSVSVSSSSAATSKTSNSSSSAITSKTSSGSSSAATSRMSASSSGD